MIAATEFFEMTIPEPNTGCLLWTGQIDGHGYGRLKLSGRFVGAHRVAFEVTSGRKPVGVIMHRCDTPACVNPAHLSEGTQADNMRDCVAKGRHHLVKRTHCSKGHSLGDAYQRSEGGRRCVTCQREYSKRYRRNRGGA